MKMVISIKKNKFVLIWIGLALIAGFLLYSTVKILIPISTSDPDYAAIEATLQKYASLRVEVLYTLDDTQLSQILANDLRGGLVDAHFLKLVQYMQGKPDLKLWQIGFLDKEQAIWAFNRKAKQLYDVALASGEIQSLDPRAVPEIADMENEAQFLAYLPLPRAAELKPYTFKILSVYAIGNFAIAKVDWGFAVEEDIFVEKSGDWLLVGVTITESRGG